MKTIYKALFLLSLLSAQSSGEYRRERLYDWMICVGGYSFENENKEKLKGFEISYLPEPYFGVVFNVDLEGDSYTRNLGVEVIGNALFVELVKDSKFLQSSNSRFLKPLVLLPGIELGGSLNAQNEIGLHTSIFLNLVIIHPYIDYNIYQDRSDKKVGVKWKIGFGPWFIKALE